MFTQTVLGERNLKARESAKGGAGAGGGEDVLVGAELNQGRAGGGGRGRPCPEFPTRKMIPRPLPAGDAHWLADRREETRLAPVALRIPQR